MGIAVTAYFYTCDLLSCQKQQVNQLSIFRGGEAILKIFVYSLNKIW